jgi:Ca-activated chloride channel family protein
VTLLGIELANPWLLLAALLAAPALWWGSRGAGRVVFSSLRALPAGGATWRTRIAWLPDAMMALAVVALAIALAGPRAGDKNARIRREGIAIMMAVDISTSMAALDLSQKNRELTRLDAVKGVFEQFVLGGSGLDGRADDAIGLVAFAKYAETRSPLTLDHGNLATAARELDFALPEDDGTALGAGLQLAVERLRELDARSKVAILLTDGVGNVHEISEDAAIDDAVKAGIKVYTIGAGTNGFAPVREQYPDGGTQLVQRRVVIDEATLRKIADRTGGQYFRATDHASLRQIYEQIDRLERTALEEERFTEYHQFYGWFVAIAMGLACAALLLRGTVLRRLP